MKRWQRIRSSAAWAAILALIGNALLASPMLAKPGSGDASNVVVICTAHGAVEMQLPDDAPPQPQSSHCAFCVLLSAKATFAEPVSEPIVFRDALAIEWVRTAGLTLAVHVRLGAIHSRGPPASFAV